MHRLFFYLLGLALLWNVAPGTVAADGEPWIRSLLDATDLVVRGRVLDQEHAPGGLWHRILVEDVIWGPADEAKPRDEEIGPTLRVYAHGPGLPEGAALFVGEEIIIGASWLPPLREDLQPFLKSLWQSFRSDWPRERPALVSPDGMVPLAGRTALADPVSRLVRGLRDHRNGPVVRQALLQELAAHPEPAIREAAVSELARPGALVPEEAGWALAQFSRELEGQRDPLVLRAHVELVDSMNLRGAGRLLIRVLREAPRDNLAHSAAVVLARSGRQEDFEELEANYSSAAVKERIRILHALAIRKRDDHLPLFAGALNSPEPRVRAAAVAELAGHPDPRAVALLLGVRSHPDRQLRQAAIRALRKRESSVRSSRSRRSGDRVPVESLRAQRNLDAARRRLQPIPESTRKDQNG